MEQALLMLQLEESRD